LGASRSRAPTHRGWPWCSRARANGDRSASPGLPRCRCGLSIPGIHRPRRRPTHYPDHRGGFREYGPRMQTFRLKWVVLASLVTDTSCGSSSSSGSGASVKIADYAGNAAIASLHRIFTCCDATELRTMRGPGGVRGGLRDDDDHVGVRRHRDAPAGIRRRQDHLSR
jgi:hypothetical protein